MSRSYCEIPWVGLTLDAQGRPQICCEALGTEQRYLDDEGRPLSSATHSFEEIRNSPVFREVRRELLADQRPGACNKCWQDEDAGIASLRQARGQGLLGEAEARKATDPSGRIAVSSLPFVPELRLSNLCNLRCRTCGPEFSSAWSRRPPVHLSSPLFDESLERSLPSIRRLFFTGGEPLLEGRHFALLETLIARGLSGRVALYYTTNLTRLPERVFRLWRKFEVVHVGVSLDGTDAVQEYLRHPTPWKTLERNIRQLDAAAADHGWSTMFQATVSIYNVLRMDELLQWFLEAGLSTFPYLEIRRLWTPLYLNVRALPPEAKHEARAALLKAARRAQLAAAGMTCDRSRFLTLTSSSLEGLVSYMDDEELRDEWPAFLMHARGLDRSRKQSLATVLPELERFLP